MCLPNKTIFFISNLIGQGRSLASFIQRSINSPFLKVSRKSIQLRIAQQIQNKESTRRTQMATLLVILFTVEMNVLLLHLLIFFIIYAFIL